MNHSTAYSEPTAGGYIGRFRLDWRSETFIVREHRDGPIVYFDTAAEAECAAWRVKAKIEKPKMVRDGETLSTGIRATAESYFKPRLVKQRGKTKAVEVVRL